MESLCSMESFAYDKDPVNMKQYQSTRDKRGCNMREDVSGNKIKLLRNIVDAFLEQKVFMRI